jgi:predicted nucleic acid-binding protein
MTTFVDTSAFFAVLDADDRMHSKARREWGASWKPTLHFEPRTMCSWKTSALLQSRIGMDALRVLAADVLPVLDIIWVDAGIHISAQHSLLVASRRDLSLVDCVSFEAMRRLRIDDVFCFDPHFSRQGFKVLPR